MHSKNKHLCNITPHTLYNTMITTCNTCFKIRNSAYCPRRGYILYDSHEKSNCLPPD